MQKKSDGQRDVATMTPLFASRPSSLQLSLGKLPQLALSGLASFCLCLTLSPSEEEGGTSRMLSVTRARSALLVAIRTKLSYRTITR